MKIGGLTGECIIVVSLSFWTFGIGLLQASHDDLIFFLFTLKGVLLLVDQYCGGWNPKCSILSNILLKSGLYFTSRNPKVSTLQNVLWQFDLDNSCQNPPCTKSLICAMKTPTIEYDLYGGYRTPTTRSNMDNDGGIPTTISNVDKKVGGDLQIVEGIVVIKECQVL